MFGTGTWERVAGNRAYVAWTPQDTVGLEFSLTPITTGPHSNDSIRWVMAYGMDITAGKSKLMVEAVAQCEGLPNQGSTITFPGVVQNNHANWTLGATLETVSDFVWKGAQAWDNAPPSLKTAVGRYAFSKLQGFGAGPRAIRYQGSFDRKIDDKVEIVYDGGNTSFDRQTLDLIFRKKKDVEHFQENCSDSDFKKVISFMSELFTHSSVTTTTSTVDPQLGAKTAYSYFSRGL